MNEFLTWDVLATLGGASIAVSAMTEIIKYYAKVNPKWIVLVLSMVVMYGVQIVYYQTYEVGDYLMSALNGIVVAGMSIGVFEGIIKNFEK